MRNDIQKHSSTYSYLNIEQNLNIYNLSTKIHGGIRNLEEQQLQEREIKP